MSETAPHRRKNLLTGEYVLVSPQRMARPWQGERKKAQDEKRTRHDPTCYLCPGNERSGGITNPDYEGTFVFQNDFPALLEESEKRADADLFIEEPARGEARVICYSPDHSATLARMSATNRRSVVDTWCSLSAEVGSRWAYVQIFENKGAMMGASSPHPHGQLWASDFVPTEVRREDDRQREYFERSGTSLLAEVAKREAEAQQRIVTQNERWLVIVPHWAAWPFETLLIVRADDRRLEDLDEEGREALVDILGELLPAYDRLFDTDFPYSMGWHGAPHQLGDDTGHWRLHAHFYPPLLRSPDIRKHMVGFELLGEAQRDLTPEAAAERIRAELR
ncbi:UDP-glucose--hexose-1-phosphate uridylyltransferase [Qipengyuania nanhaisediminis]|uniref:Galactose-1-phosphate uridylyltransferase n=1 Tax=Qipengyuania nanhaisediminis TaxID=604088 RepID=A0A1I5LET8_9SPHN|nr:UDP-glucose--hexose-1-phosphate uridylyltransferase [Qipengyuania nanhaisediminis]SFO95884.1 UDPglucose--hexose-1-phosphate uridylyltransferase [Qipengyuania nanhaisediminis]